jgi:hypothetical protein
MAMTPGTNASRRLSLSDSLKGSAGLPPRIVHYGRPGFGKTSIWAFGESPFFLLSPGETGLHTLIDSGLVPSNIPNLEVDSWDNYIGIVNELRTQKHGAKLLVMDTINGGELLANEFVKRRDYGGEKGEKEFQSYMQGYRTAAMTVWKELLTAIDALRKEKAMQVVMLAHTGTAKVANPSGGDYSKWAPAFVGKWAWEITYGWADVVLFGDFHIDVTKDKPKDAKGKAFSNGQRLIYTGWSPDYDAKGGRVGLPNEIECPDSAKATYALIAEALKKKGAE